MKKILVLAESLRINETSSGIVSSTFIMLLKRAGYDLKVLTPNNISYPITWLEDIPVHSFDKPVVMPTLIDYIPKVRAIPTYITGFSKSFRALIDKWQEEIELVITKESWDLIYVLGSGSEFAPHFAISEMNIDIPYVVNFHDPYPWHAYPEPYRKKKNWINSIHERKIRKVIKRASQASFPSQYLMELMQNTFMEIADKGFVVPHIGYTLENLIQFEGEENYQLDKSKINILHVGSLLGPRNPIFLLKAINQLVKENPWIKDEVRFILFGTIAKEHKALAKQENGVIQFYDKRFSYSKSLELIEASSAVMVIEAIAAFSPFMPGKIADIVMHNKPIIALTPNKSEIMRLLGSSYTYHAELHNTEQIEQILLKILLDIKNNKIDLSAISEVKKYISIEENAKLLKQIIH